MKINKVHVVHSTGYDYKNELYLPLRSSNLNFKYTIFLPHETDSFIKTKDLIKDSDVVLAEVTYPATGLGIELGWADSFEVPIICFHKKDAKISGSLKAVSHVFLEYSSRTDMIQNISDSLTNFAIIGNA